MKRVIIRMQYSGKWLAADCGSVKPVAEMHPAK